MGCSPRQRREKFYDALVKAELTDYLRGNRAALHLIVSPDTLVYFGELEGVIDAAGGASSERDFCLPA
jgi:predicted TPR repeat methyltransferase